jgi:hypothetical protein
MLLGGQGGQAAIHFDANVIPAADTAVLRAGASVEEAPDFLQHEIAELFVLVPVFFLSLAMFVTVTPGEGRGEKHEKTNAE